MARVYLTWMRLDPQFPAVQRDLRDAHRLHSTVMKAFPPVFDPEEKARALYGVLYRVEYERRAGRLILYVQSRPKPDWSFLAPGYVIDDGWPNPAVKPVDKAYAGLGAGKVLRFRLRANPTRKIDTKSDPSGARRNGRRVPVHGAEAQIAWLIQKGQEYGFELLQVSIAATGVGELLRSPATGRTFQGVLFEGRLVIRDGSRFHRAVTSGLGPGKAYGFGLLSISPD